MAKRPGIYIITCATTGRVYIGSSEHAPRRLYLHRRLLNRGEHHSLPLQRAWQKYGAEVFGFEMLEEVVDPKVLLTREQFWIDHYQSADGIHGFNCCPVAGTREGTKQPPSVAAKISAVHKGKPKSTEQRAKMSAAASGKTKTDQHRKNIAEAVSRQMADPERRAKAAEYGRMATSYWKGRSLRPETKELLRAKALERNADKPKAPKRCYYVRKPPGSHDNPGPKPGTPRPDRRSLSTDQVQEIRHLKAQGRTYTELERQFSIDRSSLFNIVKGKTYAQI